jgi:transcriptional regulator with XRE-family HTH domain
MNLRRERAVKRITQGRLAELSDLSARAIQKIEAGELNILLTTLKRLRRAWRCPWQRLLD